MDSSICCSVCSSGDSLADRCSSSSNTRESNIHNLAKVNGQGFIEIRILEVNLTEVAICKACISGMLGFCESTYAKLLNAIILFVGVGVIVRSVFHLLSRD